MLTELHQALAALLYDQGQIPRDEVDIRFEPPTKERIERLTRPAISFFLFGIQENVELRATAYEQPRRTANGLQRRMPPRRFDVHYLVSALSSEPADEHLLLWRVLETLLRFPELPADLLPADQLDGTSAAARLLSGDGAPRALDFWSAFGVPPRPAILYAVTLPVDTQIAITSPLVLTRTLRFNRADIEGVVPELSIELGGVVRGPNGVPIAGARVAFAASPLLESVTNMEGEFVLANAAPGEAEVIVTTPGGRRQRVTLQIPAPSYDVVLKRL